MVEYNKYFWVYHWGNDIKLYYMDTDKVIRYDRPEDAKYDNLNYFSIRDYGEEYLSNDIKKSLVSKVSEMGYEYVEQRGYGLAKRIRDFCTHADNKRTYNDIITLLAKKYISSRTHKIVKLESVEGGFIPKVEVMYGEKKCPYNVDKDGIMFTPRVYSISDVFYDVYFSYRSTVSSSDLKNYIFNHKKDIYEDVYRVLLGKHVPIDMIKPSQISIKKSTNEVLVQMQNKIG